MRGRHTELAWATDKWPWVISNKLFETVLPLRKGTKG